MNHRIVIVGSTNVDFIMRMQHLPQRGETVTDATFAQTFGGKGANTAVAAARTGPDLTTTFITALGDDVYADTLLANFAADRMDVAHVRRIEGMSTGSALIMIDADGHNYLSVAPGSNYALTPADIDKDAGTIRTAALVVMQMEIPTPTILRVLELCEDASVPVLFNYAPVRDLSVPITPRITGLVVNETEAGQLTNTTVADVTSARESARTLLTRGPRFVVVTLGAAGAFVLGPDIDATVPAFQVQAVDTTAAGDTFCGALAVALVEGKPLPEAVRFASAAAAISVTRLGAQPSVPTRAEVDSLIARTAP